MKKIYLLLLLVIIFWAINLILTKIGLQYISPSLLTLLRLIIASIVTFIFIFFQKRLIIPTWRDGPLILSIGFIQIGIVQVLITIGISYVTVGRAALLAYSTPLWATPIAAIFFQEKLTLLKSFGIFLGLMGLLILFNPLAFDWTNKKIIYGNLLILTSSLCWACALLHTKFGTWTRSPVDLMPWQLLISCIPALFSFLLDQNSKVHWNEKLIFILFYNAVIATVFCYWASMIINKRLPVAISSLSMLTVPILSLLLSVIILEEPLTVNNIGATIFIIGGLVSVFLGSRKKALEKT